MTITVKRCTHCGWPLEEAESNWCAGNGWFCSEPCALRHADIEANGLFPDGSLRRFESVARRLDDKRKLDLAMNSPKPGGSVRGPLFSPKTKSLF